MTDRIRICMVGAGRVGTLHCGNFRDHIPRGTVTTLVDRDEEILNETGSEFGIENRFTSLGRALRERPADAVVITTPTPTHKQLAVRAAEAGRHVFLEKPMAMNLQECDAIINACKENGVQLQIGFMRRFDPEFMDAAERVRNGEIGTPMNIKSLTHGPGLPPQWACVLESSNGNLSEVNSHDLDAVRWLMDDNIDRIYLEVSNFKGDERGVDSEHFYDNMIASLRFNSGGLGSISGICPCDYGYDARAEIVGKKGIMQIGELESRAVSSCVDRDEGLITPSYRRWPERFKWGYIREMKHFARCIREDRTPRVTGEDGRHAVAVVLAGTRSFLQERPVRIQEIQKEKPTTQVLLMEQEETSS